MDNVNEQQIQEIEVPLAGIGRADRPPTVETSTAESARTSDKPDLHREHAAALVRLATLERELGRLSEAERLFAEAIALGDQFHGDVHPSLAVALNELSRLYIRRSDFTRAEPLLQRLVHIASVKGEAHPEVATALAGLAVAKRGLGDDASAEQLLRRALWIREQALSPSHMGIVITLEQLSATCAARGNTTEALALLQRALPRRECALGASHATVQTLRAQIAELERAHRAPIVEAAPSVTTVSSNTTVPYAVEEAAPAEQPASNELVFLYEPEPGMRRSGPVMQSFSLPRPAIAAMSSTVAAAEIPVRSTPAPEYSSPSVPNRRKTRYASVGAAIALLAVAGFAFGSPARHASDSEAAPSVPEPREADVVRASVVSTQVAAGVSGLAALPTPAKAERTPPSDSSLAKPAAPAALPSLRKVVVPKIAMPNVDSMMRTSTRTGRDADVERIGSTAGLATSAYNDDQVVTPPLLIGTAPVPLFPEALRSQRLEGEVVVRFRVDEKGRVDQSSMQVVHSPHPLFTAAVRNVLPKFRFEPAHTGGREAKPESAWVQFASQFTVRN